jgi:hypothetical protein
MRTAIFGDTVIEKTEDDDVRKYNIMTYAGNPKIDGAFDKVIVSLDLARLQRDKVMPFLDLMNKMMVSGAEITVYVPCAEYAAKQVFTNNIEQLTFISLYGSNEKPFHACYTLMNLRSILDRAGFIVRIANQAIINVNMSTGESLQMPVNAVVAVKA